MYSGQRLTLGKPTAASRLRPTAMTRYGSPWKTRISHSVSQARVQQGVLPRPPVEESASPPHPLITLDMAVPAVACPLHLPTVPPTNIKSSHYNINHIVHRQKANDTQEIVASRVRDD